MYDTTIVLSHYLDLSSKKLSSEGIDRLNKGIKMYISKKTKTISVIGSCGPKEIKYKIIVSKLMKDYLIKHGVNPKHVLRKEKTMDTLGELFIAKREILLPNKYHNIAIITTDYHKKRVKTIAKKIMGNKIKFKVLCVKYNGNKINLDALKTKEKNSLNLFKNVFGNIKNGNDKLFFKKLLKNHILYKNKSPRELINNLP